MDGRISCQECKQCNLKGKPSVSRYSKYCDVHYYRPKPLSFFKSFFTKITDRLFEKRYDEKTNKIKTTKGFRPYFFKRF